jgi:hypothetical protein
MAERWRKGRVTANDGKPLTVWSRNGYEISLNVNRGHETTQGVRDKSGHHWWFEVTCGMAVVGESPSFNGAKRIAKAHQEAA